MFIVALLSLLLPIQSANAVRIYSIHKFNCRGGQILGVIATQEKPPQFFMAHFCPYKLLDGKKLEPSLFATCQADKTEWSVKCFNEEFVPACENRDHVIAKKCL